MVIVIDIEEHKAHAMGASFLYSKSLRSGFKTINTPINPVKIASHLLIPTFSFKNNTAKMDTKNGLEKNKAFAIASDIYVSEI